MKVNYIDKSRSIKTLTLWINKKEQSFGKNISNHIKGKLK
jgi:hypothetical protein